LPQPGISAARGYRSTTAGAPAADAGSVML